MGVTRMHEWDAKDVLKMALNLGIIDAGKYNKGVDLCATVEPQDLLELLIKNNIATEADYKRIIDELESSSNNSIQKRVETEPKEYTENFSIKKHLGHGGLGRVLLAYDKSLQRDIAIKELLYDGEADEKGEQLIRFLREAKITGQLEHPGIVPVYQLSARENGTPFYAMQYVRGRTLTAAIAESHSENPEEGFKKRMRLFGNFTDLCDAVGYAHSRGIIHRDIKPGNVILGDFGETIVLDWGLAKKLTEPIDTSLHGRKTIEDDPELTQAGQLLGTPSYMSPEQIDSDLGTVDTRSDVYSLGVILYIILTGVRPHHGKGHEVMARVSAGEKPPSPTTFGKFIPPELSAICEKAMARDKKTRFENAGEFSKELKAYRHGRLLSIYSYSKKELLKKFIERHKALLTGSFAVLLVIIIGALFSIHLAFKAQQEKLKADHALVDVTNYSELAMELARTFKEELSGALKGIKDAEKLANLSTLIPSALSIDPKKSAYQIWCMRPDGFILYDEDPKQIGKYLFTDAMYVKFPELQNFGDEMKGKPWGVGHYRFFAKESEEIIYKIAAWDSLTLANGEVWKVIVTYNYR